VLDVVPLYRIQNPCFKLKLAVIPPPPLLNVLITYFEPCMLLFANFVHVCLV
jgi:hypothetical protein